MYVLSCFAVSPEIIVMVCWTYSNQLTNESIINSLMYHKQWIENFGTDFVSL